MAKLVQKSGYIKSEKAGGYMKYIATREGVEKLTGNGPVTKGQRELIQKLLHDFPDAVELFEYEDYRKTPTLGTASAFITMALDANLHEINSESGYLSYIATRPRVERRGAHGLFNSAAAVDLDAAMSELEAHDGNVWTIIYSLRREDAARLGYDNADAWRGLLMMHAQDLAKAMKIPADHFRWYAAFHNEGHHPHIHMMVWSDDPKEGFLTREGIAAMRSKLTNTIFRDEMIQIYERKDVAYKELIEAAQNTMRELIQKMEHQLCDNPVIEEQMRQLVQALETTTGKKQYGYLKKPLKALVDTIVDELARQPEVAKCYETWNQIRDELNECYGSRTPREHLPLSQQKEFRRIKSISSGRPRTSASASRLLKMRRCKMSRSRRRHMRSSDPAAYMNRLDAIVPPKRFCRMSMRWMRNTPKPSGCWNSSGWKDTRWRRINWESSTGMISPPCGIMKKRSVGFAYPQRPEMTFRHTHSGSSCSLKSAPMRRCAGWTRPPGMGIRLPNTALGSSVSPVSP